MSILSQTNFLLGRCHPPEIFGRGDRFRFPLLTMIFLLVLSFVSVSDAKSKSWTVLYKAQKKNVNKRNLPDKYPMKIINDVSLEGVNKNDPFLFNEFLSSGLWGINKGRLAVTAGSDTMLRLSHAEDFELEGVMNAEGLGGWYILFGWNKDRGSMIYNVTLKKSGSPWMFTEFRGSKAIESTHGEINRYDWKKDKPFNLQVKNKKVSFTVDQFKIADEIEIPNYTEGDILIGTYKTRYGAKLLRIKNLRIKGLK